LIRLWVPGIVQLFVSVAVLFDRYIRAGAVAGDVEAR
jgi:hypothetical protein